MGESIVRTMYCLAGSEDDTLTHTAGGENRTIEPVGSLISQPLQGPFFQKKVYCVLTSCLAGSEDDTLTHTHTQQEVKTGQ